MIPNEVNFSRDADLAIRVDRLGFSYSGSQGPTLVDISFDLAFGQRVVLTGPSGAGKTTLGNLLLGMLDPTEGFVEIFGMKPANYKHTSPGKLSFVPQSPKLISGSLLENIALGLTGQEIDMEIISELIEKCALAGLVQELPSGVHSEIGGSERKLSGGEIQRVSLARALYSHPTVLLLDEPTDGLDAITTETIQRTIQDLSGSATVLVIAHTLSTIRRAERIIYLEKGRLSGDGSIEELSRSNPTFKSLVARK